MNENKAKNSELTQKIVVWRMTTLISTKLKMMDVLGPAGYFIYNGVMILGISGLCRESIPARSKLLDEYTLRSFGFIIYS